MKKPPPSSSRASKKTDSLYLGALDYLSVGVVVFKTSEPIEYLNPSFFKLCRYSRDELMGAKVQTVSPQVTRQELGRIPSHDPEETAPVQVRCKEKQAH